jgi:hypothetical protein
VPDLKDFSKYQPLFDKFRGKISDKNFEAKFAAATAKLPTSEKFLIKMELKRLASPCARLIDLRGLVDGECKPYEYEGKTHFLDDVARKVFEQNIALYNGYTFGVYDATTNTENNFRVIYQKEKENLAKANSTKSTKNTENKTVEKTQFPAKFYSTRVYHNRVEERMNYAVSVLVTSNSESAIEIESVTSDLSAHGCKLKFSATEPFYLDQEVLLRFIGLEKDFQFGKNNTFSYIVRNITLTDNVQWVGFERIKIAEKDSFLTFLKGFVQGNKRRYKINLDNTITALQNRSFEQFSVPKIAELPVFLTLINKQYVPKYALTCNNNQHIYQYWHNEHGQQTLCFLLNHERILRAQKRAKLGKNLIVYTFTHSSQNKVYFYSADDEQLQQDEVLFKQFTAFAASKASFKVFSLHFQQVYPERGHSPLTLSTSIAVKDEYLNHPPSTEVMQILNTLPCLITICDLTNQHIKQDYASLYADEINTQQIKQFGHKYPKTLLPVDEVGVNYRNHRQEARFIYKTPAEVQGDKVTATGESVDFSISGIKIIFPEGVSLKPGEIVHIAFPKLQQITTSFDLKKLPYKVVRVNKARTSINMKIHVENHQHVGRNFFKALIEKNRSKLKSDEYALMIPGLSKTLRNVYSRSMLIPSLLVQSSGARYKTEVIVSSELSSQLFAEMLELSDREGFYNLYPLLHLSTSSKISDNQLKKMLPQSSAVEEILYISLNKSRSLVEDKVIIKLESELKTLAMKKMFIKKAIKNGQFYCFKLVLSRTEPPDMGHLNPELSYISSYAIHRAKQLEQEIWSVSGAIRCIDMTQEAMQRYQLA